MILPRSKLVPNGLVQRLPPVEDGAAKFLDETLGS
jgi:hypothetical protein